MEKHLAEPVDKDEDKDKKITDEGNVRRSHLTHAHVCQSICHC